MIRAAALWLLLTAGARAGDVVSLNLCTDQYLARLAPERVAGLSVLARDPALSTVAADATAMPRVRADAEAVLALHPRLVLGTPFGAGAVLAAVEAHGVPVLRIPLATDFSGVRAVTRMLATALDVPERGETLLADMEAALAVRPGPPRRALALGARLRMGGPNSFDATVMRAAGLIPVGSSGATTLEALATDPPDLLVTAPDAAFPSLATDLVHHPALSGIPRREVAPALTLCAGPWSAEAVALLAR